MTEKQYRRALLDYIKGGSKGEPPDRFGAPPVAVPPPARPKRTRKASAPPPPPPPAPTPPAPVQLALVEDETPNERRARTRPSRAKPKKKLRAKSRSRAHWPHYPVEGPLPPTPNPGQCDWCTLVTFRFGCRSSCPACPTPNSIVLRELSDRLPALAEVINSPDSSDVLVQEASRERGDILLALHEAGYRFDQLAVMIDRGWHFVRDLIRKAEWRREMLPTINKGDA